MSKYVLRKLASKPSSSVLDELERKISGQGAIVRIRAEAVRAGNRFTLFIPNEEDMDSIIKTTCFFISCFIVSVEPSINRPDFSSEIKFISLC